MKFDIGGPQWALRKFSCGKHRSSIMNTLHEVQTKFYMIYQKGSSYNILVHDMKYIRILSRSVSSI